ncbi:hypothetical protein STAS_20555 [Striga asiatica]|uniref:KIB1-4 beta-propeller domain-containing protein n=1 Tax=Striga asiatica TaxID=4170 RepID=A0A5A7QFF5_STRAF|nr:hypothetical protein STAS_20555 [Striga asiatica]
MASCFPELLRPGLCGRRFAGFSSCLPSGKWSRGCNWFSRRGMSTAALMSPKNSNPSSSSSSSPWLMLQPVYESGATCAAATYKFYNLAENRVVTLWDPQIHGDLNFRGSSGGGWVSLVQPETHDVLLYNPISRRRIKLPPSYGPSVDLNRAPILHKSFLSCSPDTENCFAVNLTYYGDSMAVCCPLSSDNWKWFGTNSKDSYYLDCVYSTTQHTLFALTHNFQLEAWDLTAASPKLIRIMGEFSSTLRRKENLTKKKKLLQSRDDLTCWHQYHLVIAGEDLLVVTQYIMLSVDSDGLYVDFEAEESAFELPSSTIDFDIHRYDWEDGDLKYVEGSCLNGWALFVGNYNHSVALRACDFPELKPNSIYFTDALAYHCDCNKGNYDIGIFNYEDKTVSPCYYPCDPGNLKPMFPAPMWFFPS